MHPRQAGPSITPSSAPSGAGIIETLAGTAPFQQPQTASTADLGSIAGIAVDAQGNTFVAAQDFRSVLKIDSSGNVTVYAGQPLPSGLVQASGDGGLATAATLVSPVGLAVDLVGNLYIADPGSYTIRMVAASTGIITTVAGTPGQSGSSPSGTLAVNALLYYPTSIAVDASGNLFLIDAGAIERVDHTTGILSQYAGGNGICGALSNIATCPISSLNLEPGSSPGSIAINGGNLYIAADYVFLSYEEYTGSILRVQLSTGTTQLLAGGGSEAPSVPGNTAIGATIYPLSLTVDASGNVDFTEGSGEQIYGASTIMQLPFNGTSLATIAGTGQIGSTGDGGPATAAEILSAFSITVASSGNVLFAEPSRLRSINPAGTIATFAGTGVDNYFGDGGPAQLAGIGDPLDAIADSQGNLYIADAGNGVVRRIDASTGVITTIAGNGGFAYYQQGSTSTSSLPGDGGPANQTPLGSPSALAMGAGGNLYIGDYYQGIRVVNLGSGTITTLNNALIVDTTMAFDNQHTIYANTGAYIDAVDTTSGVSTVVAGNGENSFEDGDSFGDGGPATDAFIFPEGLALDNAGNLYIADALENGIRVVDLSTGVISVYAGGFPSNNFGFPGSNYGYSGDGGPASGATFRFVTGLHSDGNGNLLLADIGNNAIREINLTSTIINTVAGNGLAGYSGDGATATAAMLSSPYAASADAVGNLSVVDYSNKRLRRIVVNPVLLTAALTTPSTSVTLGESTSLTVTYSGVSYGIVPTGLVTFYDGTAALGTGTISASTGNPGSYVATLTTSTLAVGTQSITAQLSADANYASVTSAAVTVVVAPPAPIATLSSTSLVFTPQAVGTTSASQSVMLTNSGTAALTIASIAASGNFAETNTCGTSLAVGANCMISVTFSPQTPGALSGSLTIADDAASATQVVSLSGPGADIAVATTSAGLTVTSVGGMATAPIQIAPKGGFTGTVNLTCVVSYLGTGAVNDAPTCALNPASAQLTGSASGSSTLTISTTSATASSSNIRTRAGSIVVMASLFFLGFFPRRRWRKGVLMGSLCLIVLGCDLGCGGGGGSKNPGSAGTTVGNYQTVVSATSGALTSTVTLSITVQ